MTLADPAFALTSGMIVKILILDLVCSPTGKDADPGNPIKGESRVDLQLSSYSENAKYFFGSTQAMIADVSLVSRGY